MNSGGKIFRRERQRKRWGHGNEEFNSYYFRFQISPLVLFNSSIFTETEYVCGVHAYMQFTFPGYVSNVKTKSESELPSMLFDVTA